MDRQITVRLPYDKRDKMQDFYCWVDQYAREHPQITEDLRLARWDTNPKDMPDSVRFRRTFKLCALTGGPPPYLVRNFTPKAFPVVRFQMRPRGQWILITITVLDHRLNTWVDQLIQTIEGDYPDATIAQRHEAQQKSSPANEERPKRGAPRLTEREDAENKRKKAQKYLEYIEEGKSKKVAAGLVGESASTLRRWVKAFNLTNKANKD